MAWFKTRKDVEKSKLRKREDVVKELDDGLTLYGDIAKTWLIKCIKHSLLSILKDPQLNMNFTDGGAGQLEAANRLMKAKVRLKGVFRGLLDNTSSKIMPVPLISFLASILKPGQYIPNNLLS